MATTHARPVCRLLHTDTVHETLKRVMADGVAFHHAGLREDAKELVVKAFRAGAVSGAWGWTVVKAFRAGAVSCACGRMVYEC